MPNFAPNMLTTGLLMNRPEREKHPHIAAPVMFAKEGSHANTEEANETRAVTVPKQTAKENDIKMKFRMQSHGVLSSLAPWITMGST